MNKRLQVLLADQEWSEIRVLARRQGLTVGEWVRRSLGEACARPPVSDPGAKLKAIRRAAEYSFPTGDMDGMLGEIERGYRVRDSSSLA